MVGWLPEPPNPTTMQTPRNGGWCPGLGTRMHPAVYPGQFCTAHLSLPPWGTVVPATPFPHTEDRPSGARSDISAGSGFNSENTQRALTVRHVSC